MPLPMVEELAISEIAGLLYSYLPASGAKITFAQAAQAAGVGDMWPDVKGTGLSKLPALTHLLQGTLSHRRNCFCPLVEEVVRLGIQYKARKGSPIALTDILALNGAVAKVGFKIPSLWDPKFLSSLPGPPPSPVPEPVPAPNAVARRRELEELRVDFLALHALKDRQDAGLKLEGLLTSLFKLFGLDPNGPFRVTGEQIDGSFDLDHEVYLLEAKWTSAPVSEADLLVLRCKVEGKSQFTRGLFLSINGYSQDSIQAITRGKSPNFIMVDGAHLARVLEGGIHLDVLLRGLVRRLAETGHPYIPLTDL